MAGSSAGCCLPLTPQRGDSAAGAAAQTPHTETADTRGLKCPGTRRRWGRFLVILYFKTRGAFAARRRQQGPPEGRNRPAPRRRPPSSRADREPAAAISWLPAGGSRAGAAALRRRGGAGAGLCFASLRFVSFLVPAVPRSRSAETGTKAARGGGTPPAFPCRPRLARRRPPSRPRHHGPVSDPAAFLFLEPVGRGAARTEIPLPGQDWEEEARVCPKRHGALQLPPRAAGDIKPRCGLSQNDAEGH